MRTIVLITLALAVAGLPAGRAPAVISDEIRQPLQMAVVDAQKALATSKIPRTAAIAVLPIGGDAGGYVLSLLKNALSQAGLNAVEGKEDPLWEKILAEVEWDERKGDMLDPATLDKFGKLQSAKLLLYGAVRAAEVMGQRVYVEIELHATAIETKQHLWGGTFAKRYYLPGRVEGLVDLDSSIRDALKKALKDAAGSLAGAEKLRGIKTALLVPLAGDSDAYVTGIAKDIFRQSPINPKDADVLTLGEARVLLRDQPQQADAIVRGAVRDLSREVKNVKLEGTNYLIHAEVQLEIQAGRTGEILWSDTVAASAEQFVANPVTPQEAVKIGLWNYLQRNPKIILWIALGVVGLLIVRKLINMGTRIR
jgi:hypothetical protein